MEQIVTRTLAEMVERVKHILLVVLPILLRVEVGVEVTQQLEQEGRVVEEVAVLLHC